MSSASSSGYNAETRACKFLEQQGFMVLQRNWKTKYCEIDIVAQRAKVIYFVEVKYRRNTKHGSAIDYITPKKLQRMQFAAEIWVQNHKWAGEYQLAAVAVDAEHIDFIDSLF